MRRDPSSFREALGLWDHESHSIIIKRDQLRKLEDFAGTLVHESVHASSGKLDVTLPFEKELTNVIGRICRTLMRS